jgi:hypothetical protein
MHTSFDLRPTGDLRAMNCEGCELFASCEELQYINGDKLMLCGNCHQFIKKFAMVILKNKTVKKELKKILSTWREKSKGFNFDPEQLNKLEDVFK